MRTRVSLLPAAAVVPALAMVIVVAVGLALITHRGSVPLASDPSAALMRGVPDYSIDQLTVSGTAVPPGEVAQVPRSADVAIGGWIILVGGVPNKVTYRIDGGAPQPARSHLPRPDVADSMSKPTATDCGFRIVFPRGTLSTGSHAIRVFYTDRPGAPARALPSVVRLNVAR